MKGAFNGLGSIEGYDYQPKTLYNKVPFVLRVIQRVWVDNHNPISGLILDTVLGHQTAAEQARLQRYIQKPHTHCGRSRTRLNI